MTEDEKRLLVFRHIHNKENPYVVISKEGLDDKRLSWKARGILSYLLGKPDTWKVIMEHLKKEAPDGIRSLRSGLLELQFFGYLEKFVEKERGRFKQFGYNIYEISQKPDITVEQFEKDKENKKEIADKRRKVSHNHPFLRFAQMENSTLVSNDIVSNELRYTCESCLDKGEQMCEKCEQVKREIETGKEHGFELGVSMKKKHLKELQKIHEFEGNTDVLPKQSVEQKVLQMMSGHDEYAEKASGYPETVQKSVKLFAETFKISPSAIPKKSKGKGGMFATWVKGIQDLQSIAGNERRFKLVLDKVFEVWNNRATEFKTHVDMPQKIRGSFVTMESELTQLEEKQKQEIAERVIETTAKKEVYITDDETLRNEGVADLKKLLRSYKNG